VRRLAIPLLAALLVLASLPDAASADLGGLRLDGPPGAWRANNFFFAEWDETSDDPIGYRFVNVAWAPPLEWQQGLSNRVQLVIPTPPGASAPPTGEYLVELWLWSNGVNNPPGPSSYLTLRYDVTPPGPPLLTASEDWIDPRGTVSIAIDPPNPLPASGVRGYAVSASSTAGAWPCAAAGHCTDADLDQPGGAGHHEFTVGPFPEGITHVNVVAVSVTGFSSPVASIPVRVDGSPPAIRFDGLPAGWVDHPVVIRAVAEDRFAGMTAAGPAGAFTALAIDGGVPSLALGGAANATVSGEGAHQITAWARDRLGNAAGPERAPAAMVRIDETPPRVSFAPAQRHDDPELIEASVIDELSGASPDRGSIELRPAGTTLPFERLPTEVVGDGLQARWSSDDYPAGGYELRATGFDLAGNSARSDRRAGGAAMVLRNPIKVPTALESGFGGAELIWQHCHRVDGNRRRCEPEAITDFDSRPALWTVPYGRSLRFGGVLRTSAGAPLADLPVEIIETFAAGADAAVRRTTVTTRAKGRFDAHLAPGPSRRVEAYFPGTRTLTRASGRSVTMAVRAGVRFGASTSAAQIGGEPVVFSGRLLAHEATVPRTGRPIQLQFRLPGRAWSEFRSVQTDRRGRFRYPYEFTDDDSRGIRFQLRAVSPEQSGWPYRPAASAPVAVTGY
jgi:hypothetical protein